MPAQDGPLVTPDRPASDQVHIFAVIEGLVAEEDALLRIPAIERSAEQHRRLHTITDDLDRALHHLSERAERLTHPPQAHGS